MTDLEVVEPHAAAASTPALRAPVSRRRVLHGIAWGTPAILIATASPPAAASVITPVDVPPPLPAGTGVEFNSSNAAYQGSRWNESLGQTIPAVNIGMYIQNKGNGVPNSSGITLTLVAPVGTETNPIWGIGNGNGVAQGQPWTLASGPSVNSGYATLILVYTGPPLSDWQGVSVSNLWMRVAGSVSGQSITLTLNATYVSGQSSSHSVSHLV